MDDFSYQKPKTVSDALEAHGASGDSLFLAGGQTILPVMKLGLAALEDVIDLGGIEELRTITATDYIVTIGALATHAAVAESDDVNRALPALASLASVIGDPQVRNLGTIGGSIANNDPAADYPAAVLALGATIITNNRQITADDFFVDMFETALDDGELITQVEFQVPAAAAYVKFANPASRFALAGVFVSRIGNTVRVAVTGAGPCVFRAGDMEAALEKNFSAAALDGITIPTDDLNTDIHASAEYRSHLIGVLAKRAVVIAAGTVNGIGDGQ